MVIKIIQKGNSEEGKKITPTFKLGGGNKIQVVKVVKKVPKLTLRQERVVAEVGKGGKSKAEILRKAGYSAAVVDNPGRVFDQPDVQLAIAPIVDRLTRHRDAVLERMEKLVGKAGYTSLSITLSHINKDIELLAGRPTSREEYVLDEDEQKEIDRLLKLNS